MGRLDTVIGNLNDLGMPVRATKIAAPRQALSRVPAMFERLPVRLLREFLLTRYDENGKRTTDLVLPSGTILDLCANLGGGIRLMDGPDVIVYDTARVGSESDLDGAVDFPVDFPVELQEGVDFAFDPP